MPYDIICIDFQGIGGTTMKISKELLKGSTEALVLSAISREDMYGYKIVKEIDMASGGAFVLNEGTLYPILHTFENDGLVESYWEEFENRKRKYYHITKKGLRALAVKKEEFEYFSASVKKVLEFA